jgi:DICT domain-containing protein/predicted DNA-binding transcriptional regulator AlpA
VTSTRQDASSSPEPGLTIGDLAHRTGLAPATLRAWETRFGFPRPRRLSSGHRRYDEHDVELVAQVVRRKDAGVRLETAISEAAESRRAPSVSVFAELRRRHPHLTPQPLRKSTLLALTWAMEDECCARAQRPTLFAAFQHERYYRRAEDRWAELARTARRTVVFAGVPGAASADHVAAGITLVELPPEAPMRREWSLVCDAPDHPAALAAWELPGQSGTPDRDRVFESLWTLEPPGVRDAARACAGLVEQLAPELAVGFEGLDDTPARASDDLRAAASMFSRLVAYVDRGGDRRAGAERSQP